MYKIPKQSYTVEFKQEAVRQIEKEGKSPAQVAREVGYSPEAIAALEEQRVVTSWSDSRVSKV
jgi:transposase-like protein